MALLDCWLDPPRLKQRKLLTTLVLIMRLLLRWILLRIFLRQPIKISMSENTLRPGSLL